MTMPLLGRYALFLAVMAALYTVIAGWWANHTRNQRLQESVRGAAIAVSLSLTAAVFVLEYLLVTGDYSVVAVFNHSDRALPLLYKMGALWGGDSGSVLFWGWILSLYTAFVAWRGWPREGQMTPMVVPLLGTLLLFYTGMSNIVVDPFRLVSGNPTNGNGLDPLLQNLVMTIHPPAMYTGLIGMSVPAAYILAALWTKVPSREWLPVVRRWMLVAWMFLSVAIVLGGMWAYMELGWGGYWEWDPVENAALLPWLLATAFLHSIQLEEKRGMFRWWTAFLGVGSFLMTLVATYITRSGVLKNSVHSFTGTGVGPYFVGLFWFAVAGSAIVFILRRDVLRDRMVMDNTFSKEGIYLLLNAFFAAIAAVVLFGTFYPIISKAFLGTSVVLSEHFFNAMTAPMFLALVLLLGTAPVVGWRSAKWQSVIKRLWKPWVVALAVGIFAYIHGYRTSLQFFGVIIAVFSLGSMVQEFYRATRLKHIATKSSWVKSFGSAIMGNRRRYGGYLAHISFLIIVLGVIGSHTNNLIITRVMSPGQTVSVRGYHIRYLGLQAATHPGYQMTQANIMVSQGGHKFAENPGLSFFPGSAQPVATVAIRSGVMRDLYMVLEGSPGHNQAILEIFVNPMVSWIWMGMYLLAFATLIAMGAPINGDAAPARSWEFSGAPIEKRRLAAANGRDHA
ncbi:MAG: cytochrome C assembly protein [Sulfobacillus benefaciens]|uniref:Cytochrome C assembly protein n=1 Tax=Sulfobacillus benefaciens TaxID=453960 RepID=A0A2T2XHN7_9FIRM|nr:MAG: cytochrome C assembly protein [Sulfobacillus benefaciens]